MTARSYPAQLQTMITRAGELTADQIARLGDLWKEDEALVLPPPSIAAELMGALDLPLITNQQLVEAWQRALDAAGTAGRVDEIEAAEDAGRALRRDERHKHDTAAERDGSEEAVRSATLAVGVRDLIGDDDFRILTAAWQQVLGPL